MKKLLLITLTIVGVFAYSQQKVNKEALYQIAFQQNKSFEEAKLYEANYLKDHTFPQNVQFQGFSNGIPVYLSDDSRTQIISMNADYLHSGEISAPATGSGLVAYIWDGGSVRDTHQEFTGRVTNIENTAFSDHSTGVAGVIMGGGANSNSRGIAYEANLKSYNYSNNLSEISIMSGAPINQAYMVSNHSYGSLCGWYFNESNSTWYWYGYPNISPTESVLFGIYVDSDATLDNISYNAPQHSIFKSAGNNHSEGPTGAVNHYVYDENSQWVLITDGTVRPQDCTVTGGYDCIPFAGSVAKNIILVGAVDPLSGNGRYDEPSDVVATWFTSYGPTDDGRIKPDVTAIGLNVFAPTAVSDTNYTQWAGTSFSSPAAAGVGLLLEQIENQHTNGASYLRSDMMKAILTHSANESGTSPGPDYKFGYGLIDAFRAAQTILNVNENSITQNNVLNNGGNYTLTVTALGTEPLKASIAWLDPAGTPAPQLILNDRTPMLVNDLDLRISDGSNTFYPWKLNPENPSAAATQEDNVVDNVEQVLVQSPVAGQQYTILVTHKGTLQNDSQNYALVVTGVDSPLSTNDVNLNDALSVYPNPVEKDLNLQLTKKLTDANVRIFNQMGQIVYENQFDNLNGKKSLDLSSLTSGVYMLYIKSEQGIITKKLIKK